MAETIQARFKEETMQFSDSRLLLEAMEIKDELYRAHAGLGSTDIKYLNYCPKALQYYTENKNPRLPTPSMKFGTAVHNLLLYGTEFCTAKYVKQDSNYKKWKNLLSNNREAQSEDDILKNKLSKEAFNETLALAIKQEKKESGNDTSTLQELWELGHREQPIYSSTHEDVLIKAKPDIVHYSKSGAISLLDLKTYGSRGEGASMFHLSNHKLTSLANSKEWCLQLAHYAIVAASHKYGTDVETYPPITAYVAVIIPNPPAFCRILRISHDDIVMHVPALINLYMQYKNYISYENGKRKYSEDLPRLTAFTAPLSDYAVFEEDISPVDEDASDIMEQLAEAAMNMNDNINKEV